MNTKLQSFMDRIKGKKIAIIGAGISNRPLIAWLYPFNQDLTVFDMLESDDARLQNTQRDFTNKGIHLHWITGKDYLEELQGFDLIFRTPKMRLDTAPILRELEKGVEFTSEIKLFTEVCPAPLYAVTGSDGKTTTTTLISEILKEAGHTVYTGGNIGTPLLDQIAKIRPEDRVVLELSSFQLMDMAPNPNVAVITNIIPNHLDFHLDFAEYIDAKKNLILHQTNDRVLVLNAEDPVSFNLNTISKAELRFFNMKDQDLTTAYREGKALWLKKAEEAPKHIVDEQDVLLPGSFNLDNILAAALATLDDVPLEAVESVARTFKGVPHRMELVKDVNDVRWYNSSVDSSPPRTIRTLSAFEERHIPIILITGGQDKNSDYTGLGQAILEATNRIILSGQNAELIRHAIEKESAFMNANLSALQITEVDDYEAAVKLADRWSMPGDAVLLSPAGTSYDRFHHFEERGEYFRDLVTSL